MNMIKLLPLFSDHMVLQQGKYLPIWGEGSGKVCVQLGDQRAYTLCEEGYWRLTLPPMPAGGPYTLTVQDNRCNDRRGLAGGRAIQHGASHLCHGGRLESGGGRCERAHPLFYRSPPYQA